MRHKWRQPVARITFFAGEFLFSRDTGLKLATRRNLFNSTSFKKLRDEVFNHLLIIPCKVNPDSGIPIQEICTCGKRNPGLWNPQFSTRNLSPGVAWQSEGPELDYSYTASVSFTREHFTCVRTKKIRDSGNQPLVARLEETDIRYTILAHSLPVISWGTLVACEYSRLSSLLAGKDVSEFVREDWGYTAVFRTVFAG